MEDARPPAPYSQLVHGAGSRLKATRLALGYQSQTEFAQALGIQSQRLNQWEQEKHPPDVIVMAALKRKHNVSLDWIYMNDWSNLPTQLVQRIVSLGAAEDAPAAAVALRHSWGFAGPNVSGAMHEPGTRFDPFPSPGFREAQAAAPQPQVTRRARRSKPA